MKHEMKFRALALLLVVVMLLGLLGGCRAQTGAPDPSATVPAGPAVQPEQDQAPDLPQTPTQDESGDGQAQNDVQSPSEETPEQTLPAFPQSISLRCRQAFVYDCDEEKLLAIQGAGERLRPASVTKLLTILTCMQYLSEDTLVTPGDEQSLVAWDSSIAYVNSTHTLTAAQLVEGMLLPSGNDAACALSAAAGRALSGDAELDGVAAVQVLVEKMNEYAENLGMTGSQFNNPDGYYDDEHYTTVEDMALLTRAAWQSELIRRYCGLASDNVTYYSGEHNLWENTNLLLQEDSKWYNPYVTGIKTGSLTGAYCLVFSAQKDGKTYLAGVFSGEDDQDRYGDATAILDWLLEG